ncbi:MAG TPA: type IV secretory system conjugative DNA transfer family protein [Ramlibacter sp.]|uniref:type IV secretory system conjugative DNA transfer family protein n=1 Tax=Ramlibacter sp. TaxID=1917967 RepID=UPI002C3DB2A0|nr:type IV secretory system conjugative DNA transfer family protein [Ramlibacter sp.]HVZ42790.1 type IV secretory system conjugative DNA transfer family protein [Ramlibacter sp.]
MATGISTAQGALYRLPGKLVLPGQIAGRYIGGALMGFALVALLCTQYLAFRFGYQEALGKPFFDLGAHKVYEPFGVFRWYQSWGKSADPAIAMYFRHVMWGGAAAAAAIAIFALTKFNRALRRADDDARADHLHGSAHWATPAEVHATGLIGKGAGVYVGAWKHPSTGAIRYLRHDGPEHVMAFAPTRSGKGVGLVLPTLLSWPHSALVYDIKGENWALTSGWRSREAGNRVLKFEPTAADGSSVRFNPLAQVRLRTGKEVADMQNLMTMIVDPDGKGLQDHWQKSSQALLVGVGLHVLYAEENKTLSGVVELLSNPNRTIKETLSHMLGTVHDTQGDGWNEAGGTITFTHPVVAAVARDMMNKAEEEMSSVLSTAISYLTLYRDPVVAANTSGDDFMVPDLMNLEQPVSLYLVVPPSDKDRLKPLIRLIVNQVVRGLTEKMEFAQGRSVAGYRHRLLLLIDEFPSLGKLDVFEESLAFIAGYGLKAYLIIQDISQLWTAYGKDESIFSNCHVRLAYAPNKVETAELLSKMVGTTTVVRDTRSYSGTKFSPKKNVSIATQETQRPLLSPDEVMRLPAARKDAQGNVQEAGDMLVFMAGHAPIYGKQILYFMDPVFSERAKVPAPAVSDRVRDTAAAA